MSKNTKMYASLRGRIISLYGSQDNFAKEIGISNTSVSKKLSGLSSFSTRDIIKWSQLLNIPASDIGLYFFSDFLAVV